MKDVFDVIKSGEVFVCPECGGYDDADYELIDDIEIGEDAFMCAVCGQYFR